jgi:hypothetical protein
MVKKHHCKKRPCRVCRQWFTPDPRVGDRQKTCGSLQCQRQWHIRICAEWNRKNRSFFQESYLRRRLGSSGDGQSEPPPLPANTSVPPLQFATPLDYPRRVVQEVIGVQQLVIIEYIVRLLLRDVQEEIRPQVLELQREFRRLPPMVISRGDSQRPP